MAMPRPTITAPISTTRITSMGVSISQTFT
jgi:hypothetical protein